ncbi:MAG: DUF59 domain-containing protein [Acidobacteriota bacterium]
MNDGQKGPKEEKIVEVLRTCFDPEIPVNIYDMGLVYEIELDETGGVLVRMTLTSPNCPVAASLPFDIKQKIKEIPGVTSVHVDLVWDPPWSPDMMTEAAKLELGML